MSGDRSVKTEAIVLRSLRYGEADRILHLYTPGAGGSARSPRGCAARAAASAAASSRSCACADLPRGPRRAAHGHRRSRRSTATRACATTPRRSTAPRARATPSRGVFETEEPHPAVYNLLCQRAGAARAGAAEAASGARTRSRSASSCWSPRVSRPRSARARRAASASTWSATRRRPAVSSATPARPARSRSSRTHPRLHDRRARATARRRPRTPPRRAARGRARDRRDARAPRPPAWLRPAAGIAA